MKPQWLVGGPPGGSCVGWAAPPLLSPLLTSRLCRPLLPTSSTPIRHKGGDPLGPPYSCSACVSGPESLLLLLSPFRQCCALGRGRLQWWREERRKENRPSQSGPAPIERASGLHHNNTTHDNTHPDDTNKTTFIRHTLRLVAGIWYYTIRSIDVHGNTKRFLSPPIRIRFTPNSQGSFVSPPPTHPYRSHSHPTSPW